MNTGTSRLLLVTAIVTFALTGCSTASKTTAPPPEPAPVAAPEPAAPAPEPPPPPPTFVIEDVNFDFDEATLKPSATETLDRVAAALREQPEVRYEVAGYTDSIGSDAYNQSLSERRAGAVREYLVGQGVDDSQLSARGYGESNPVASNSTSEDRAKNRRVEVRPLQ